MSITDIVPPGVVTGDNLVALLNHARENAYAIRKLLQKFSKKESFCDLFRIDVQSVLNLTIS